MRTLAHVAALVGLVGIEALVAGLILMPGLVLRGANRTLQAATEYAAAAAGRARARLRELLRPRGPRFRPPRFA